jgi:hypothetical protein
MKQEKTQDKNLRALSKKEMKSLMGGEEKYIWTIIDSKVVLVKING